MTLSVTTTYSDAYGNPRTVVASVGVYVSSVAVAPLAVSVQSPSLVPGAVNDANFTISNVGGQNLKQLQVSVSVPPSVSLLSQFPRWPSPSSAPVRTRSSTSRSTSPPPSRGLP